MNNVNKIYTAVKKEIKYARTGCRGKILTLGLFNLTPGYPTTKEQSVALKVKFKTNRTFEFIGELWTDGQSKIFKVTDKKLHIVLEKLKLMYLSDDMTEYILKTLRKRTSTSLELAIQNEDSGEMPIYSEDILVKNYW